MLLSLDYAKVKGKITPGLSYSWTEVKVKATSCGYSRKKDLVGHICAILRFHGEQSIFND